MNLGEMIDRMYDLREEKRELTNQIKELDSEFKTLEERVQQTLKDQGSFTSSGTKASVTRSERKFANPTNDWNEVFEWVKNTNSFHILKQSLNSAPLTELEDMGQLPDCITIGHKNTLSLTKRNQK